MASNTLPALPPSALASSSSEPKLRRFPKLPITDAGKVRLGGQGPIFGKAAIADAGKVRLGGQGPIFG